MNKHILLSISVVVILGGCTTASQEVSDVRVNIVKKAMNQHVSDVADQMDDVSAAEAMDCKFADGVAAGLMTDKQRGSVKMGVMISEKIWDEVYARRTNSKTAALDDILAFGPLMSAVNDNTMSTEAKTKLTMSTLQSCTAKMKAATTAAKTLRNAKS